MLCHGDVIEVWNDEKVDDFAPLGSPRAETGIPVVSDEEARLASVALVIAASIPVFI